MFPFLEKNEKQEWKAFTGNEKKENSKKIGTKGYYEHKNKCWLCFDFEWEKFTLEAQVGKITNEWHHFKGEREEKIEIQLLQKRHVQEFKNNLLQNVRKKEKIHKHCPPRAIPVMNINERTIKTK